MRCALRCLTLTPVWRANAVPSSQLGKDEPIRHAMDGEFRNDYATTPNAVLAARYAVTTGTILKWARRAGLRKDPEYRRRVQRSNASKRRLTIAQRQHLSELARGRRHSPETIAKALATKREHNSILRGARHPFWKGGRPWERFRNPSYIHWR